MTLRLEQYGGVWALHRPVAEQLLAQVRAMNLTLHVEQQAKSKKRRQRPLLGARAPRVDRGPEPTPATQRKGYLISDDGVAVLEIIGTLTKYGSSAFDGPATVDLRRGLRTAVADPAVQRMVLLIDSPGGSVSGIDDLAGDIAWAASQKPVCAYIEDLGASGAVYLASQAGRISANQTAWVGSIGVYTVIHDMTAAYDKLGIETHVVSTGGLKGATVEGQPVTDELLAELQKVVDATNQQFTGALMRGRGMTAAQVAAVNDGRIYTAAEARQYGLIDAIETWDDMLAATWPLAAAPAQGASGAAVVAATEEIVMNDQGKTAPAADTPKAATLTELKGIAGATPEFREMCQENGFTLAQAQAAWTAQAASRTRPEDALRGANTAPLPTRGSADTSATGDVETQMDDAVRTQMERNGGDRRKALQTVARRQPELHREYVEHMARRYPVRDAAEAK